MHDIETNLYGKHAGGQQSLEHVQVGDKCGTARCRRPYSCQRKLQIAYREWVMYYGVEDTETRSSDTLLKIGVYKKACVFEISASLSP